MNRLLISDMNYFEVYKKDGESVNYNHFMSSLIAGYYERYNEEISKQESKTKSLLARYIFNQQQLEEATSTDTQTELLKII